MIVQCVECGREVSERAKTCPGCGNPIARTEAPIVGAQTIEATGKGWKFIQLLGGLTAFGGIGYTCVAAAGGDPATDALVVGLVGLAVYLAGRVGAWWCHG